MLHLYYFESLLEQHDILYGYKFGLEWWASNLGIIKIIIESALNTRINLMPDNVLRYKGGNIRVMLVDAIVN